MHAQKSERGVVSDYRKLPSSPPILISGVISSFFCADARDSLEWIFHLILKSCLPEIASSLTFFFLWKGLSGSVVRKCYFGTLDKNSYYFFDD